MMDEDIWRGDWVLFSFDPTSGVERWYNPKEDLFRSISHVDGIVNANKEAQNNSAGNAWGDGQVVASIPLETYYETLLPAIQQEDHKYVARWLNDGDNRAWRQKEGVV